MPHVQNLFHQHGKQNQHEMKYIIIWECIIYVTRNNFL